MHFKYKRYIIRLFYALLGDLINADNVLQKKRFESRLEIENHLNYFGRGGLGTGTQKRTGTLTGGTNWDTDRDMHC